MPGGLSFCERRERSWPRRRPNARALLFIAHEFSPSGRSRGETELSGYLQLPTELNLKPFRLEPKVNHMQQ